MDLGLQQKQVAAMLGVSEDSVCYWENNRVTPSRLSLTRIVRFLDTGLATKFRRVPPVAKRSVQSPTHPPVSPPSDT